MNRVLLGEMNRLVVARAVDFGLYLDGGEMGDILLPTKEAPTPLPAVGDEIEVFIYLDQEERLVATSRRPKVMVGGVACLTVAWTNNYGAFMDWGLMKDLFVPFREQKQKMQKGERHIVHVHLDDTSHRIVASAKVERYLSREFPPYADGDAATLLVWHRTPLGYKVIVDGLYTGLLYEDQVFKPLHTGDTIEGFVKHVREDGKIDCILQPTGRRKVTDFSDTLLQRIKDAGGILPLGDKSDAEAIYAAFGVSKKVFKQTVGALYKQHLITVEPEKLTLA